MQIAQKSEKREGTALEAVKILFHCATIDENVSALYPFVSVANVRQLQ